jgi:hydroxymethylbilane synthase
VEGLVDRDDVAELFVGLGDIGAAAEVECERAFAAKLEGGCSVPLGCLARSSDDRIVVTGFLGTPEGTESLRDRASGPVAQAEILGAELAQAILDAGGDEILADLREIEAPQPSAP